MKRVNFEPLMLQNRLSMVKFFFCLVFLYLLYISFEIPVVFKTNLDSDTNLSYDFGSLGHETVAKHRHRILESQREEEFSGGRSSAKTTLADLHHHVKDYKAVSGLLFNDTVFLDDYTNSTVDEFTSLHKAAKNAWVSGKKVWNELLTAGKSKIGSPPVAGPKPVSCPHSVSLSGSKFINQSRFLALPCGLTLNSHITVVGVPHLAHAEIGPRISTVKDDQVMVSQFRMELQGLKTEGSNEDPPRILHFNPRLKGDWSGKPVIEQNTCYRMQWGTAMRCEGWQSGFPEDMVDGQVKCEKWIRDDNGNSEESKAAWWLNRLIGRKKKVNLEWPYPFTEGKLFVLTVRAGLEGYHISVDGRHVTSFPYRTGFLLEDATGLSIAGDIDVHSVFAASLPHSLPSSVPQNHLQMVSYLKAPPLPEGEVELFIGVLSAGNHFAERMAVRKSWMQHKLIRFSNVVARFFVALHGRMEVNVELKKEADYFRDIVIVPYMDSYDLVVLKTVAICEYGVRNVAAKYIMKADDDNFVRVDAVLNEVRKVADNESVYIGNMNYYHQPLRHGKWAVTYEEWPEEVYPPYANGPGYIISLDIAQFIVSKFEQHKLRLFKMEDVSMGMWVENFHSVKSVSYIHSLRYCQFGCIEGHRISLYIIRERSKLVIQGMMNDDDVPVFS
ncbi:hypothetical protein ACFE04_024516 [Oxalis oulophora]